jgi:phytoene dehydrogenase-like protein
MKNSDKKKKVAIIGAGIAGLSAGSYLVRNGFDVSIFEKHDIPGGQCTSWKKGKYTFDGCVHWLIGSKPGDYMNHLWKEVGALEDTRIIDHDIYRIEHFPDGTSLRFFVDVEKLEAELLNYAPEDKKEILKFISAIKKLSKIKMPEPDAGFMNRSLKTLVGMAVFLLRFLPSLKWLRISAREYGAKFKNRNLGKSIENLFAPDFAMLFNLMTLVWLGQKNAGYPIGGSLSFSKRIAKRYEDLGGKIHYKSPVKKILVEENSDGKNDQAAGVVLENGSRFETDYVISASDGRNAINTLLGEKYHNPRLKNAWEVLPVFDPLLYISLGIDGELDDPHSVSGTGIHLKNSVDTGGRQVDNLLLHSMAFDETLAPPGKSVIEIMCVTNFDFWNNLRNEDVKKYRQEKERIADAILNEIDRNYFPGFKSKIEKIDIATPTTWQWYTGVYRGAFEGLQLTKDVMKVGMSLPKQLNGLDNFYLCGQWVEPGGGLPPAVYSGKDAAFRITRKENKKFIV